MDEWIKTACSELGLDPAEIDRDLILDLARDVAHGVEKAAAPITTFLLGYAAALHGADPDRVEELAGRASALAETWDGKTAEADDFEDVEIDSDDDELVDVD